MNEYIATFHTHADALIAHRALISQGADARMMPVPRKLSSSCGTCVRYHGEEDLRALLTESDYEAVYQVKGIGEYQLICSGDKNE